MITRAYSIGDSENEKAIEMEGRGLGDFDVRDWEVFGWGLRRGVSTV